jgi:hypothetical protein
VKSKTFATLRAWVEIRLYPVFNKQMSPGNWTSQLPSPSVACSSYC